MQGSTTGAGCGGGSNLGGSTRGAWSSNGALFRVDRPGGEVILALIAGAGPLTILGSLLELFPVRHQCCLFVIACNNNVLHDHWTVLHALRQVLARNSTGCGKLRTGRETGKKHITSNECLWAAAICLRGSHNIGEPGQAGFPQAQTRMASADGITADYSG